MRLKHRNDPDEAQPHHVLDRLVGAQRHGQSLMGDASFLMAACVACLPSAVTARSSRRYSSRSRACEGASFDRASHS
jgi:hypothetical protein